MRKFSFTFQMTSRLTFGVHGMILSAIRIVGKPQTASINHTLAGEIHLLLTNLPPCLNSKVLAVRKFLSIKQA